jgi:hypothetical protein
MTQLQQHQIQRLKTLRQVSLSWAPTTDNFPSKANQNQGDMVLFNGLLTYSGYMQAGPYIPASISDDGRPTRSPRLANAEPELDGFSKDMLLGILLYSVKTKDSKPLQKVMQYVKKTGCLCPKSSDNRCKITPTIAYLTNKVAKHLGIKERLFTYLNGPLFSLLEWTAASFNPKGYQLHLVAVKTLIRQELGEDCYSTVEKLNERDINPFFVYLSGDKVKSYELLVERVSGLPNPSKFQWSWEREDSEKAYNESMGWDTVFMCNMLLK